MQTSILLAFFAAESLVPMNLLLYFTLNIYQKHNTDGFLLKNHFMELARCSQHLTQQISHSHSQKDEREAEFSNLYLANFDEPSR